MYVHQDAYLFSSYFYERLKCNFKYAIEVAEKKVKLPILLCNYEIDFIQQVHILNKKKWLIPICTMFHWHAAVRDQNKQITIKKKYVVALGR